MKFDTSFSELIFLKWYLYYEKYYFYDFLKFWNNFKFCKKSAKELFSLNYWASDGLSRRIH